MFAERRALLPGLRVLLGPYSAASPSRCLALSQGQTVDDIPKEVLIDCAHLVKANSIQGNTDSRQVGVRCFGASVSDPRERVGFFFGANGCGVPAAVLSVKPLPAGLTGSRCRLQLPGLPVTLSEGGILNL